MFLIIYEEKYGYDKKFGYDACVNYVYGVFKEKEKAKQRFEELKSWYNKCREEFEKILLTHPNPWSNTIYYNILKNSKDKMTNVHFDKNITFSPNCIIHFELIELSFNGEFYAPGESNNNDSISNRE